MKNMFWNIFTLTVQGQVYRAKVQSFHFSWNTKEFIKIMKNKAKLRNKWNWYFEMILRSILIFLFLINDPFISCMDKLDGKNHQNRLYAIRSEAEQKFKVYSNLQLMFERVNHWVFINFQSLKLRINVALNCELMLT